VARKLPATARPGARRAAICCAINGTDPAVSGGRAAAPGVLLIDGLAGGYVYAKVATLDVMPPGRAWCWHGLRTSAPGMRHMFARTDSAARPALLRCRWDCTSALSRTTAS
jgi:hypothetical protein